jgi:predicted DNA-binding protein (MmcQ/YjbR family)
MPSMPKAKKNATNAVLKELRAFGLAYPGAHLKSPWPGHLDLAVKDKTFASLSIEGEPFGISCKLPQSNAIALLLPFTEPTSYGLGKSGWVSAKFPRGRKPPVEMLKEWIDESYRAQAPKKLVRSLEKKPESKPVAKAKTRRR